MDFRGHLKIISGSSWDKSSFFSEQPHQTCRNNGVSLVGWLAPIGLTTSALAYKVFAEWSQDALYPPVLAFAAAFGVVFAAALFAVVFRWPLQGSRTSGSNLDLLSRGHCAEHILVLGAENSL